MQWPPPTTRLPASEPPQSTAASVVSPPGPRALRRTLSEGLAARRSAKPRLLEEPRSPRAEDPPVAQPTAAVGLMALSRRLGAVRARTLSPEAQPSEPRLEAPPPDARPLSERFAALARRPQVESRAVAEAPRRAPEPGEAAASERLACLADAAEKRARHQRAPLPWADAVEGEAWQRGRMESWARLAAQHAPKQHGRARRGGLQELYVHAVRDHLMRCSQLREARIEGEGSEQPTLCVEVLHLSSGSSGLLVQAVVLEGADDFDVGSRLRLLLHQRHPALLAGDVDFAESLQPQEGAPPQRLWLRGLEVVAGHGSACGALVLPMEVSKLPLASAAGRVSLAAQPLADVEPAGAHLQAHLAAAPISYN